MQVLEIVREHRCQWDRVSGECVTESCDRINTAVRLAAARAERIACNGGQ